MSFLEIKSELYIESDFTIHNSAWRRDAKCAEEDRQDLFMSPSVESEKNRKIRESAAKEICNRCISKHDCLVDAILNEEYEIRGGLTAPERKALYPTLVTLSDITGPTVMRAAEKLGVEYVKVNKRIGNPKQ